MVAAAAVRWTRDVRACVSRINQNDFITRKKWNGKLCDTVCRVDKYSMINVQIMMCTYILWFTYYKQTLSTVSVLHGGCCVAIDLILVYCLSNTRPQKWRKKITLTENVNRWKGISVSASLLRWMQFSRSLIHLSHPRWAFCIHTRISAILWHFIVHMSASMNR